MKIIATIFDNVSAKTKREISWEELVTLITNPQTYPRKDACPLVVLGTFGNIPNNTGCLRYVDNMLTVTGIECDYDGEAVSMQDAIDTLTLWGLQAVVYTSASYTPERPRWRVLLPLSKPCTPAIREQYVESVNDLFDEIFARESYAPSQSYFFGKVTDHYKAVHLPGDHLDISVTVSDIPAPAIDDDLAAPEFLPVATDEQITDLRSAIWCLADKSHGENYHDWCAIGNALKAGARMGHGARSDDIQALWLEYCANLPKYEGEKAAIKKWRQLRGDRSGIGAIFKEAQWHGWENPRKTPTVKRHGFHFKHAGELLSAPKPVSYLIDGLIETESLALLFAPPSAGKSFLAISWCASIATGEQWLGRDVQHGAVFYLAGEGHAGVSRRLRAWELHYGIELRNAPLFISNTSAALMDVASANTVIEAVENLKAEHGEPALIVIDTFARNMGSGDENSTADVNEFVNRIDEMRERLRCGVLLVHHSGHGESERGRGASALPAAMDSIFRIDKKGFELVNTKAKESELAAIVKLNLLPVQLTGWRDAKGRDMKSAVLVAGEREHHSVEKPLRGQALEAWIPFTKLDSDGQGVHLDAWRAAFYSGSSKDPETKKRAFQRARDTLIEYGYVTVTDDVYMAGHRTLAGH
jgi:hypothetical protein